MDYDFRPPRDKMATRRRLPPRWHTWLLCSLLVILLASLPFIQPTVTETEAHSSAPQETAQPAAPEIRKEIIEGTIAPGDTASALLGGLFSPAELHELGQQSKPVFSLSRLTAGQPYRLSLINDDFARFEYDIDRNDQLIISLAEDGFQIEKLAIPYTIATETIQGTIESSLFEAVTSAGESDSLAMNLADIFAWDIDFILDIRQGDTFQALVEKRYRDGKPAGYGRILAAEFTNQGIPFQAILFQDGKQRPSYYDRSGQSLRKAFLKAPLSFSRISSGFTMRRFHPITKTWKAHPAIDYAAATGTPIMSVGDGTIIKKGYTAGNGNYIKIRHNNSYETLYLHMKGFAKGMAEGKRVSQGQTIGYVGSTGLATGPHLCFRMYKGGEPINPNKVKETSADPVSKANRASFNELTTEMLARLAGQPAKVTARNETAPVPAAN